MIKLFWIDENEKNSSGQTEDIEVSHGDSSHEFQHEEVWQIALDVLENHESIYILAPVAGVELADIDISVHETTLSISWTRNKPKEFYEHAMEVKNEECFWWKFLRKVILWDNMDFSAVKAVMENNLLVIHIPKIRFDSQNIKINRVES